MKYNYFRVTFAFVSLLSGASFAAPAVYTPGDILMGFRATEEPGSNSSYVVNLGPVATLRDATTATTLSLGNIKADLDLTFGTDWHTRTDLFWGVAGTPSNTVTVSGDPYPTLYGSRAQTSPGVAGTAWIVSGASIREGITTLMSGLQNGFLSYQQTANSTKAVLQNNATDNYDWRAYMAPGGDADKTTGNKDFGSFADVEALPSQTLSLFRLPNQQQGVYEGYFSISAAGVVTFTPGATSLTYAAWATTNSPGQTASQDFDNDGLQNGVEFFMGTPGNAATPPISLVGNTIVWPRAAGRTVSSFGVEISTNLGISDPWHAPVPAPTITASSVTYALPIGMAKVFARLVVTP